MVRKIEKDNTRFKQIVRGKITKLANFGAFARIDTGIEGLIPIVAEQQVEPVADADPVEAALVQQWQAAQTMQQNAPALALYEKLRFTKVDEGVVYRKGA